MKTEEWNLLAVVLTAVFTAVAAMAAAVSARESKNTVDEMKKTREAELSPNVQVYLNVDGTQDDPMQLVIWNRGKSRADEVKITFKPDDLASYYPDMKSILELLKKGIGSLGVDQTLVFPMGSATKAMNNPKAPETYIATVEWTWNDGSLKRPPPSDQSLFMALFYEALRKYGYGGEEDHSPDKLKSPVRPK